MLDEFGDEEGDEDELSTLYNLRKRPKLTHPPIESRAMMQQFMPIKSASTDK